MLNQTHLRQRSRSSSRDPMIVNRVRRPAVGNHHRLAVACLHCGITPPHFHDAAADIVDLDPVAIPNRVVQLEHHPAQHIPQGFLHGKCDDGGDDGGRGHQAGEFHPCQAQPQEAPADEKKGGREILQAMRAGWKPKSGNIARKNKMAQSRISTKPMPTAAILKRIGATDPAPKASKSIAAASAKMHIRRKTRERRVEVRSLGRNASRTIPRISAAAIAQRICEPNTTRAGLDIKRYSGMHRGLLSSNSGQMITGSRSVFRIFFYLNPKGLSRET